MAYTLSPRAQRDIEDIWSYTEARWGAEQAKRYLDSIERGIKAAAANPLRARSYAARQGYRKLQIGSHMIFFTAVNSGIDVVRILHIRMDSRRHL